MRIGTGVPAFECTSGENVTVDMLCDGNQDCTAGDDETTPLCESEPLHVCTNSSSLTTDNLKISYS